MSLKLETINGVKGRIFGEKFVKIGYFAKNRLNRLDFRHVFKTNFRVKINRLDSTFASLLAFKCKGSVKRFRIVPFELRWYAVVRQAVMADVGDTSSLYIAFNLATLLPGWRWGWWRGWGWLRWWWVWNQRPTTSEARVGQ